MNWTHEEKGRVADYLKAGMSAAEIAAEFGDKTRNAIIGVVQRDKTLASIGFIRSPGQRHARDWKARPKKPRERGRQKVDVNKLLAFQAPAPQPVLPLLPPHSCGRPIFKLGPGQCRFAVNDAWRGETHLFCGEPSEGGWCQAHRRIVYREDAR